MIVYDDSHLAYWERTRGKILDALRQEPRVCILYANFKAQRDGVLESGFLRFFGTAELHESGSVRDKIFGMLLPREQTHRRTGEDHQRGRHPRQADHVTNN